MRRRRKYRENGTLAPAKHVRNCECGRPATVEACGCSICLRCATLFSLAEFEHLRTGRPFRKAAPGTVNEPRNYRELEWRSAAVGYGTLAVLEARLNEITAAKAEDLTTDEHGDGGALGTDAPYRKI